MTFEVGEDEICGDITLIDDEEEGAEDFFISMIVNDPAYVVTRNQTTVVIVDRSESIFSP